MFFYIRLRKSVRAFHFLTEDSKVWSSFDSPLGFYIIFSHEADFLLGASPGIHPASDAESESEHALFRSKTASVDPEDGLLFCRDYSILVVWSGKHPIRIGAHLSTRIEFSRLRPRVRQNGDRSLLAAVMPCPGPLAALRRSDPSSSRSVSLG